MSPEEYHPVFVHYPIALTVTALVFDWGRWIFSREKLLGAGFWGGTTPILIAAFVGAIASVFTGLVFAEPRAGDAKAIQELLEAHETLGLIALGILALLVFWRIGIRGRFPMRLRFLYLVLLLALVVVIGFGAYFGGQMVYTHGVGVDAVI